MTRETITSRKNPLAQRARAVRDGRDKDRIFVEGVRLCEEALDARLAFEFVLFTEALGGDERGHALLTSFREACEHVIPVSEQVLEAVADTATAQGVVAVALRPRPNAEVFDTGAATPLVVVMHRVSNPANAGAMLRVAEAAGATAAVATAGSADLLSPKSLRGAMGSAFRLPLVTGVPLSEALDSFRARGLRVVATAAGAEKTHTEVDWTGPAAVVMGPEAGGLSAEETALADQVVRIPMRPPVESLNVAAALAVLLYEAARQRRFKFQ
jgi:RNA methyltransferase, TrmH family